MKCIFLGKQTTLQNSRYAQVAFPHSFWIYLDAVQKKKKERKKASFHRKASALILLRVLSIFMPRWISIRWVNHVIDFHPVTSSSGICDVQTAPLLPLLFPAALCQHLHTYMHFITIMGNKYDLSNPFRPHDLLLIVISLTYAAHGRKTDTRSLPSHHYGHYNKIRYENKLHFLSNLSDCLIRNGCFARTTIPLT